MYIKQMILKFQELLIDKLTNVSKGFRNNTINKTVV